MHKTIPSSHNQQTTHARNCQTNWKEKWKTIFKRTNPFPLVVPAEKSMLKHPTEEKAQRFLEKYKYSNQHARTNTHLTNRITLPLVYLLWSGLGPVGTTLLSSIVAFQHEEEEDDDDGDDVLDEGPWWRWPTISLAKTMDARRVRNNIDIAKKRPPTFAISLANATITGGGRTWNHDQMVDWWEILTDSKRRGE